MNVIYAVLEENPGWNRWAEADYDERDEGDVTAHALSEPHTHEVVLKLQEYELARIPVSGFVNLRDRRSEPHIEVIADTLRDFIDKLVKSSQSR